MGVCAMKCGSAILDALALPCVASTSKVIAGDTDLCGLLLVSSAILVLRDRLPAEGEALGSLGQASPPDLLLVG